MVHWSTVIRGDGEGQIVRRLKSATADRLHCTRALTTFDNLPSEQESDFLLAGVTSRYNVDLQYCDMSTMSPVVWQKGRWRTLESGAPFVTEPDRSALVPVEFSSGSAQWLLGKEVSRKRTRGVTAARSKAWWSGVTKPATMSPISNCNHRPVTRSQRRFSSLKTADIL